MYFIFIMFLLKLFYTSSQNWYFQKFEALNI